MANTDHIRTISRIPFTARPWYAWLVLTVVLLFTAGATALISLGIRRTDDERFAAAVDAIQLRITQRMDTYIALLRGTGGLVSAHGGLDRETLHTYIDHLNLRSRYPAIQGIGWSVKIPPGGEGALLSWFASQGFPEVSLQPPESFPALRGERHANCLIEPLDDANRSVLGYDMMNDPSRHAAMVMARDEDRIVATGPTHLRQLVAGEHPCGFLLYLPVYTEPHLQTVVERQASLRGFVYAAFLSEALLRDLLEGGLDEGLALSVMDAENGTDALVSHGGEVASTTIKPPASRTSRHEIERSIPLHGRTWILRCCSTPAYESGSSIYLVPWLTGASLVFALGLFGLARAQSRAVLAHANVSHECLAARREAEISLSISQRLASDLDLPTITNEVVKAGCELTGALMGVFLRPDSANPTHLQVVAACGENAASYAQGLLSRVHEVTQAPANPSVHTTVIMRQADPSSCVVVPVKSRNGKLVGALLFAHPQPERFTPAHEKLLHGLAAQAAIALDNASLFEAERAARSIAARRADDLAHTNAELEQFAYVSSHDLQEPLRTVTQYLDLLKRRHGSALDAQARRYIDYASESAVRMYSLLNDLLTYSRIGRVEDRQLVSLGDLVEDVRHDLAARIREAGAEIICGDLPTVRCEGSKLRLVFQNLISNALKFRAEQPPRCTISAERDLDGVWIISVIDNGIGISPEHHTIIFEVFERLHDRENFPGTGIGLAICRKVISQHRGKIWIESKLGQGASFRFTLPDDASQLRPAVRNIPSPSPIPPTEHRTDPS